MSLISKAIAGFVLGFILSACLLALLLWPFPDHGQAALVPALIALFPLWIGLLAASFMFRSAARAWLVLGLASLLCHACLQWLHHVPVS